MADSKQTTQDERIKIGPDGAEIPSSEHWAVKAATLVAVSVVLLRRPASVTVVVYSCLEAVPWFFRLLLG